MANVLKKSTGLTGLAVEKYPLRTLNELYGRILRALSVLPKDYEYRKNTELTILEKIDILSKCRDPKEAEEKLNSGQLEEAILAARSELSLAKKMDIWKPWQPLMQKAPEKQWTWPPHQ